MRSSVEDFEVILVDDNSSDGSVQKIKQAFYHERRLKIIEVRGREIGFSSSNNLALNNAKGRIIVTLNNDTIVDPEWLNGLYTKFDFDKTLFGVQLKILKLDSPTIIDSTGTEVMEPCIAYARGFGKPDKGLYDDREPLALDCVAAAIRREHLRLIFPIEQLFDPDYFLFYDEVDTSFRARVLGLKIIMHPSSIVYHARGSTRKKRATDRYVFHLTKNRFKLLLTLFPITDMLRLICLLLIVEFGKAVFLIPKNAVATLKIFCALFWIVKNIRSIVQNRYYIRRYARKRIRLEKFNPIKLWLLFKASYANV